MPHSLEAADLAIQGRPKLEEPTEEAAPAALDWLPRALGQLDKAGLRRRLVTRDGPQAAACEFEGRRLVNFSSNDYLGLACDVRLAEAAQRAIQDTGWGSGASPLVTGRSRWHAWLEERLARFEGAEAALLFPTGFAANAGVVPALVDQGDAVFADAKNHASLIDGCRLSRADRFVYPHNDSDALAELLATKTDYRRRLIVTDSLFSMDGDVAPLDRIAELATRHGAMLMIDEAHATGVWGRRGRGVLEHFADQAPTNAAKLEGAVSVRVGTLSKALGSVGGFVCGSQALIDWLANRARTYVYSTAMPAAAAAAGVAGLEIIEAEPSRRSALLQRAARLRDQLRAAGFDTGASCSQVVPIVVGDAERAMRIASALKAAGMLVPGIRPPSVPEGESLLRVSLCHDHTEQDCDRLVRTVVRIGRE
ncbi:MAG: 8-amino-7-oxononanoate synthase [Planctomycetota bacterium]